MSSPTPSRPVTAPATTAPVQSAANSRDDAPGRFTSSPWEGLYWEAGPSTEARYDENGSLDGTLGRFLMSLMYGE
ncbi:hypothetical protein [Paenarthrobacter ureafaciens]|uniref:hypothetical protein n=1 Tax=Paenarthrobacter ureafaciens TaxID=37931 RepID=UPI001C2C985E|nr:hypothetical protein [Paenarthrobacter ureafaciens]